MFLGQVLACLDFISTDPRSAKAPDVPLGVLTSANRDIWADLRHYLIDHLGNGNIFKKIDSALYCLTFDDMQGDDTELVAHNFLHGDGKNRSDLHVCSSSLIFLFQYSHVKEF